jgi:hypothetical protein
VGKNRDIGSIFHFKAVFCPIREKFSSQKKGRSINLFKFYLGIPIAYDYPL